MKTGLIVSTEYRQRRNLNGPSNVRSILKKKEFLNLPSESQQRLDVLCGVFLKLVPVDGPRDYKIPKIKSPLITLVVPSVPTLERLRTSFNPQCLFTPQRKGTRGVRSNSENGHWECVESRKGRRQRWNITVIDGE